MKKTLLITLDFPPANGGVANYLKNLCRYFPRDEIIVLAPEQFNASETDKTAGYKIYRKKLLATATLVWPKWIFMLWHAIKIVKAENIKMIVAGQILPVGTVALIMKTLWKIPYIISTHAMDVTFLNNSYRKSRLAEKIIKESEKVVTVSGYTKKELIKLKCPERKIVIISPATDIDLNKYEDFRNDIINRYGLKGKKIILTVGRLVERKGHLAVLTALIEVKKRFTDFKYIIGSKGPFEEKLIHFVKDNNLKNHVVFTGEISDLELPSYYKICDIFIMTPEQLPNNDVEGFGIVYLEANSFGKPVIATNSGGISDAVINGKNGILTKPGNTNDIAQAILKLFTNERLAVKLGDNGRKMVNDKFRWKNRASKLERLLS